MKEQKINEGQFRTTTLKGKQGSPKGLWPNAPPMIIHSSVTTPRGGKRDETYEGCPYPGTRSHGEDDAN